MSGYADSSQFLASFALPLVTGGQIHVGPPIDAHGLAALEEEVLGESEASQAIARARRVSALRFWPDPINGTLNKPDLALLAGAHNLLYLSHPSFGGVSVGARGAARLVQFTESCLQQVTAQDDTELVLRHTLLRNLPRLTRTDVEVHHWAGVYRFRGMTPPPRILRWQKLRRVRVTTAEHRFLATELSEPQHALLRELLRQSPLTDVLEIDRPLPPLDLRAVAPFLASPRISRVVCYAYLDQGLDRIGAPLCKAFWELAKNPTNPDDREPYVSLTLGFVLHLYALSAFVSDDAFPPACEKDNPMQSLALLLCLAIRRGLYPEPAKQALALSARERLAGWIARAERELADVEPSVDEALCAALRAT